MSQTEQEQIDKQRRAQYHGSNLNGHAAETGESAQILHTLSEVDDLPMDPTDDPVMGQLISKISSTANLSKEEVRSNEWVRQYTLLLYLSHYPTQDGCHGSWRGWAHGDSDAALEPLSPKERTKLETLVTTSNLVLSRSEDAKVIEEGTRDVSESIVNEQDSGGGSSQGILGRLF